MILAPIVRGRKGEFKKQLQELARSGFVRARIDGVLHNLDEPIELDKKRNHTIEIVVDRLLIKNDIDRRLEASVEQAIKLAKGIVLVAVVDGEERLYSEKMACIDCGVSIPAIEPRTFSFNSMYGACETCHGLGVIRFRSGAHRRRSVQAAASGWTGRHQYLARRRDSKTRSRRIAQQLGVDLSVPFEQLPQKVQDAFFYGVKERGKRVTGIIDFLNGQNDRESPLAKISPDSW